jgi:hypothetical protein
MEEDGDEISEVYDRENDGDDLEGPEYWDVRCVWLCMQIRFQQRLNKFKNESDLSATYLGAVRCWFCLFNMYAPNPPRPTPDQNPGEPYPPTPGD